MCIHSHTESGFGSTTEAALYYRAQAGCRDSLNRLMAQHEGLVQAIVRQQALDNLTFNEALQAGRTGLWHAILGFEPSRGLVFSTYAWPCIKHQVWRAVKVQRRQKNAGDIVAGLDLPDQPNPIVEMEEKAIRQALYDLVQRMPPRLRRVIVSRYGLNGTSPFLYRQIGGDLGLTGERARQLHTEALIWLRHPAHSYLLRSLLDRHTLAEYEIADSLAQQWLQRRGGRYGR